MIDSVDTYLDIRRAAGFALLNTRYLLRSYARFCTEHHETCVRATSAIDWASQAASLAQRHRRYETVRLFCNYMRLEDSRHESLPPNHFGYRKTRPTPRIYSPAEIKRLIRAASQLQPRGSLRPHTYVALISMLAATGLRISEALGLLFSDITPDGLLIRKTKFQKNRIVPLHETAAAGLRRYLTRRRKAGSSTQHLFLSKRGGPLGYIEVYGTFLKLVKSANLLPLHRRKPGLHGLRHTFAVRALESSPRDRRRIGLHMLALATYLGHVNINATYWYLESTPNLMRNIAGASETFMCGGQP